MDSLKIEGSPEMGGGGLNHRQHCSLISRLTRNAVTVAGKSDYIYKSDNFLTIFLFQKITPEELDEKNRYWLAGILIPFKGYL